MDYRNSQGVKGRTPSRLSVLELCCFFFIIAGSGLFRIVIFVGLFHYGPDSRLVVVLRFSACQNAASIYFHFGKIVCFELRV